MTSVRLAAGIPIAFFMWNTGLVKAAGGRQIVSFRFGWMDGGWYDVYVGGVKYQYRHIFGGEWCGGYGTIFVLKIEKKYQNRAWEIVLLVFLKTFKGAFWRLRKRVVVKKLKKS